MTPGIPLYESGPPGSTDRVSWTEMAPRTFTLAAVAALPLNLFTCGESAGVERPCWFPDETAVTLVGADGGARRVELEGLTRVRPEVLVTSDNPARPIRGAYVGADGTIWILSSGSSASGGGLNGAWLLGHYRADGRKIFLLALPMPARAILRIANASAVLLAADGKVVEVRP
jgi:hypothetical protein